MSGGYGLPGLHTVSKRSVGLVANYFHSTVEQTNIDRELEMWGNSLRQQLDMPIAEFDEDHSRFYRFVMPIHKNKGVQDREYK